MGNYYPTTVRKDNPQPLHAANDNRKLVLPTPANDNWPRGPWDYAREAYRVARPFYRRMKWGDLRAQLAHEAVALVLDRLLVDPQQAAQEALEHDFAWDTSSPTLAPSSNPSGYIYGEGLENVCRSDRDFPVGGAPIYCGPIAQPNLAQNTPTMTYQFVDGGWHGLLQHIWTIKQQYAMPHPTSPGSWLYQHTRWKRFERRLSQQQYYAWAQANGVPLGEQYLWSAYPGGVTVVTQQPQDARPLAYPTPLPRPISWRQAARQPNYDVFGNELRGPVTTPASSSPPYRPAPPKPGTKERKFYGRGITLMAKFAEGASEVKDFVWALYEALPSELQQQLGLSKGYADIFRAMEAIYTHINEIDVADAVTNYLNNNQGDRYVGTLQGELGRARRRLRIVTGPAVHGVAANIG